MEKRSDSLPGMNIVVVGHVDHGKSTVIGRLLADTHSLPEGKLAEIRERCKRNAKPFEYAFLLDALKDEQAQGITIDSARCFFKTAKRRYIIIDAPGHIEFLKNMISGASRAEAALLVIDAREGIMENSMRHGYMLAMLGVRQITVLVNKMDLVGYDEAVFAELTAEYAAFLAKIGVTPHSFIPVSGSNGDNIAHKSARMPWFHGETVLSVLDSFRAEEPPEDLPFRMPVQDVYKFASDGDLRRIIAGTVESGRAAVGSEIEFFPSGKKSRIKSVERFAGPETGEITAGMAAGFTMSEQIYVKRGEIAVLAGQKPPEVTSRMKVSLFWLGKEPLETGREYTIKLGTAKAAVRLEQIISVMDASSLENRDCKKVLRNDIADCILSLDREIAFDRISDLSATGRFVLVDRYEISGGGIIREALPDRHEPAREKVALRNRKWEKSEIPCGQRAARFGQKPLLILLTGSASSDRKGIARSLEKSLFDAGYNAYFLGIGNVLYGVDADIKTADSQTVQRDEHVRRLSEVCYLLLDAGLIVIATAIGLTREDLKSIRITMEPNKLLVCWVGNDITTDILCDRVLAAGPVQTAAEELMTVLRDEKIIR
jgi:bifunctional enzyme CysN/CysC